MNDHDPVLKKCVECGAKIDLAARVEREKHLDQNDRSRHDYCARCQKTNGFVNA